MNALRKTRLLQWWQAAFIVLNVTWLFGPGVNSFLSHKAAYISQFEGVGQPFSFWFRTGDVLGAALLLAAAIVLFRLRRAVPSVFLLVASLGMMVDALFPTCHVASHVCGEHGELITSIHDYESIVTFCATTGLVLYDAIRRRRLYSIVIAALQLTMAIYTWRQFAPFSHFNTLVQFGYFSITIVWIAWYVGETILNTPPAMTRTWQKRVRRFSAIWLFANGVLTLMQGLVHLHFIGEAIGRFREYLPWGGWIAQHSVISGLLMLYVSRHLLRGELRARQLALVLISLEIVKYSVVTPHRLLLLTLLIAFVFLFVSRGAFRLGTVPVTVSIKKRDALVFLLGIGLVVLLGVAVVIREPRLYHRFVFTIGNYTSLIRNETFHDNDRAAVVLARTLTVFITASAVLTTWLLFRPVRVDASHATDRDEVRKILEQRARHTEDYFKYWPADKQYYWNTSHNGFLAYKAVGPTVFVLADPVGASRERILHDFTLQCQSNRQLVCCLPVYRASKQLYERAGYNLIQIGSSAVISVAHFAEETQRNKWWRWQRNRAAKLGYNFNVSLPPHNQTLLAELEAISNQWLATGGHKEQGFAMGHFDREYLQASAVYYLTNEAGVAVAFANKIPQFTQSRTTTIDMIRFRPDAENSMPFLLYSIILKLAGDGSADSFDLGFVPFAKTDSRLLAIAEKIAQNRFSARGLEQFKNKFEPDWQPNYLAYTGDLADLGVIASKLGAVMEPPAKAS